MENDPAEILRDLRSKHQNLMQRNLEVRLSAEEVRAFMQTIIDAGAVVPAGRERQKLRNMLFFWAADQTARENAGQQVAATLQSGEATVDLALPSLAPYRGGEDADVLGTAETPIKPSALAERNLSEDELRDLLATRTALRIGAFAREYKASTGKDKNGYLLFGSALEEARAVMDRDPDIQLLVEDSRAKVRRDFWVAGMVVAGFVLLSGAVAFWIKKQDEKIAEQKAQIKQAPSESLKKFENAFNSLKEGRIGPLEELAKEIDVSPSELSQVVVAKPPAEATSRPPKGADPRTLPASDKEPFCLGAIWLGSETAPRISDGIALSELKPGQKIHISSNGDLRLRSALPDSNYTISDSIGVVAKGSEVAVTSAPTGYLRPNGLTQYWAEVRTDRAFCTRIFIQYTGASTIKLDTLKEFLTVRGFVVMPAEMTDKAKGKAEIRYFWPEDRTSAETSKRRLMKVVTDSEISIKDMTGAAKKGASGTIEIWVDFD